jgi:ABC-type antimicrobial peptide transport system permease subunit
VAERSRELGLRMALGAQRGDVLKMVVGSGLKLAAIGSRSESPVDWSRRG